MKKTEFKIVSVAQNSLNNFDLQHFWYLKSVCHKKTPDSLVSPFILIKID